MKQPTFSKGLHYLDDYDRFFVLIKEPYSVLDFSDAMQYYTYLGFQSAEYIGGQNRSLIVVCRESYLNRSPFRSMIEFYAPIPLLARIGSLVLTEVARAANEHSGLLLSVNTIGGETEKVVNLTFADLSDSENISKLY